MTTKIKDRRRAEQIARQIAEGDKTASAILGAIRGCGPLVWLILDSQPRTVWGLRSDEWHPYLRQIRNAPTHRIFDAINQRIDQ